MPVGFIASNALQVLDMVPKTHLVDTVIADQLRNWWQKSHTLALGPTLLATKCFLRSISMGVKRGLSLNLTLKTLKFITKYLMHSSCIYSS